MLKTKDKLAPYSLTIDPLVCFVPPILKIICIFFVDCVFARNVWDSISHCPTPPLHTLITSRLAQPSTVPLPDSSSLAKILLICWKIWDSMNNLIFRGISPHPSRVIFAASCVQASFDTSIASIAHPPNLIFWKTTPHLTCKLNFAGYVLHSKVAAGFVIRNDSSSPIVAGATSLGDLNVLMAEAAGLRLGLIQARKLGLQDIYVEGDFKLLIDCINGSSTIPWRISTFVNDIKRLVHAFSFISFTHVFREANFVADALANLGHSHDCIWINKIPLQAATVLLFDNCASGCPRGFVV